MQNSESAQVAAPSALEAAVITAELLRRPKRAPDFRAENEALTSLMKALREANSNVLQVLAETALRLCRAHSAGISIAEESESGSVFRWHGAAGRWSSFLGQTMPRDSSPCGLVLAKKSPLLMVHPERHVPYPSADAPPLAEVLLVPFELDGQAVGTVWVIAHDETRKFDWEDLRVLSSLCEVAAVAYQLRDQASMKASLAKERAGSHLLRGISAGLEREADYQVLYEEIVQAAMTIMASDFSSLQLLDTETNELQLLAWRNFHPESASFWKRIRADSTTSWARVVRNGERIVIGDTEHCNFLAGTEDLREYRHSDIRSIQSTPLTRGGKLIGILSTHWRVPHEPSSDDLAKFDVLATLAAELLERAKTQEALRATDRRKDEFLAVLSHELRNPLSPLLTGVALLQSAGNDPELVSRVHDMMRRQLAHLVRLVDDLLDLSRVTHGKLELRRGLLDLRVVVDSAIELTRSLIDRRGHELRIDHPDHSLTVDGDLQRLTQVLANVLGNAARYTPSGGVIQLRYGAEDDRAVLRVKDTGIGLPADQLDAVFQMFSQIPKTGASSAAGGLGIGLALARRLIELHGGSIVAASAGLGQGSEFIISLPLVAADLVADSAEPSSAP